MLGMQTECHGQIVQDGRLGSVILWPNRVASRHHGPSKNRPLVLSRPIRAVRRLFTTKRELLGSGLCPLSSVTICSVRSGVGKDSGGAHAIYSNPASEPQPRVSSIWPEAMRSTVLKFAHLKGT